MAPAGLGGVPQARWRERDHAATRRRCDYAAEERSVDDCQVFRSKLSISARHDFVLDLLAVVEASQSRAFNGGNVDKNILAAVVGEDRGIRHAYIKPRSPQLNGKFERSHRSDQEEFYQLLSYNGDVDLEAKLAEWERFYNFARPHGAFNGKTPYEALRERL